MVYLSEDPNVYFKLKNALENGHKEDWKKLAEALGIPNIFVQIEKINHGHCTSDGLLQFFIRNKVTVNHIILLLKKANLLEILAKINGLDPLRIVSHSPVQEECHLLSKQSMTLTVNVEGSLPVYKWTKDGNTLEEVSNNLCIDNFDIQQQGLYTCTIQHDPKFVDTENVLLEQSFIVKIQPSAPVITQVSPDITMFEGEKIELQCSVDGFPKPLTYWLFQNENGIRKLRSSLIEDCRFEDSGLYQCVSRNHLGECKSRKIRVLVKVNQRVSSKPSILKQPSCGEKPSRSIGEEFVLSCVVRCSMNVDFYWSINGHSVEGSSGQFHAITNKVDLDTVTHRSFLNYTVSHKDPVSLKIVCSARSPDGSVCSNQVEIRVRPNSELKVFTAHHKLALLVGNSDYKSKAPPLFTPKTEIRRLAKKLQQLDFEVLMMYDIGLQELRETIKMVSMMITPGDYLLFLYAGHGFYNGEDQLMTIPQDDSNVQDTLSFTQIRTILQKNQPALFFCILDMCRQVVPSHKTTFRVPEVEAAPANKNYICLHATSEGFAALENPNESSVLSAALLQHLSEPIDALMLCTRVIEDIAHMPLDVRKVQIPKLTSDLVERRSLCDTQTATSFVNFYWQMVKKLPKKQSMEIPINENRVVKLTVEFTREIEDVSSNAFYMQVGITTSVSTDLQVSFDPSFPCKQEKKPTLFRVEGTQKLKEPLTLGVKLKFKQNGTLCEKTVHVRIEVPGIAQLNLMTKLVAPSSAVRQLSLNVI